MNSQTGLSILRTVLTLVGSFIVGHAIFGHTVTVDIWSVIIGAAGTVGSIVWGIYDKTATVDGLTSAVRSVITAIGGLAVSSGWLTSDNLTSILGLAAALLPAILSHLDRVKTTAVATGDLKATVSTSTGKVSTVPKMIILILLSVGIASSCSAQVNFFGPLAVHYRPAAKNNFVRLTTPLPDSTYFGVRPVASVVVQAFPGNFSLAGLGAILEHDTYNATTGNMYTDWGIAALFYAGGNIPQATTTPAPPTTPSAVTAFGLNGSFFNKRVSIGYAYALKPVQLGSRNHSLFTVGTSFAIIN